MKPVQSPHWPQLSALLDELLDADDAARDARLAQLRLSNAELADELAALLAEQGAVDAEEFLAGSAIPSADTPLEGRQIGAYTVEAPLGAGGMGSVWLARRSDGRYQGKVALKLLNLALLGRTGAARFEREGSALARLTHPHIARLLDAGVAPGGQPYLVLEHVEGEAIDAWCDRKALSTRARVEVMLGVLDAVAHAHRKLVLHRDLKPGNILVTGDGQPKLLDFGIAKLLDTKGGDGTPAAELTQAAGRAFTPDYAAPEQVEGGEVTTATDVYALGVLLVVLLSGAHPTARPTDTPVQRLRGVIDTEPKRPSTLAAADAKVAAARAATPARLASTLRGDLDNICARALKKDPAERYATVDALADDLRRYLAHQPVQARPDSFGYRAAKFVRRHRVGVGAAALVALAIVAGVVGTVWQAVEAERQRVLAVAERDRAQALLGRNEAIADFVGTMFTEALTDGQAKAVQQLLERAEPLATSLNAGHPERQAEVLRVLASYYTALTLPNKQVELLDRARAIVAQVPDRSLKARLDCQRAAALNVVGRTDEALKLLEPWLADAALDPVVGAECLNGRARIAQNLSDAPAARRHVEAALALLARQPGAAPRLEAGLLGDLAFALHLAGESPAADARYEEALARLRALGRGESFDALRLTLDRGVVRYAMGDYRGGLAMFDAVLEITGRQGGEVVPPGAVANRAHGLEQLGRHDEALAAYERAAELSRRTGFLAGEAYSLVGQASVLDKLGRGADAQARLDAVQALLPKLPPSSAARAAAVQARLDFRRGDLAAAERRVDEVAAAHAAGKAGATTLANAQRLRAEIALKRGDAKEALAAADAALAQAKSAQGRVAHSEQTGAAWLVLGRARALAGDVAGARDALTRAQAEFDATVGELNPDTRATIVALRELN